MKRYFIIYKPFQVLSQFSKEGNKKTLADFFPVPKDVYPVGRLDYDSEGLLILTNNKSVNHRLLNPAFSNEKEYWVQVEGSITENNLEPLKKGIQINVDGKAIKTKPCEAFVFDEEPLVPERFPPIRFRKSIPASWIKIILKEGKNRQVRKMTAAIGFPTLRLIRWRIKNIQLNEMQPGDMMEMNEPEFFKAVF